jgi:hypothetical protein
MREREKEASEVVHGAPLVSCYDNFSSRLRVARTLKRMLATINDMLESFFLFFLYFVKVSKREISLNCIK